MKKKLIEVALPLEAINVASAREKSIRHGHPSTLHLWWARRPLAACRAVLFASLVDDPSSLPDEFPTEEAQEAERQRLFRIIEELVKWENSNNPDVLARAHAEIMKSTDGNPPPVLDPFCGGGSIPLEAQRLGLEAHGSDLNPVPVLITKALIEIPPKFAGQPPINPESRKSLSQSGTWIGATGLAEDVRYYGKWMRNEAEKRIGHLYPKVKLPKSHGGGDATVIAWIWARTVKCPNPACGIQMPLVRSFSLSTKAGKATWVDPVIDEVAHRVRFEIVAGAGKPREATAGRRGSVCVRCSTPVPQSYVRSEGVAKRIDTQLMAIVAESKGGRIYLPPTTEHETIARSAVPEWIPDTELVHNSRHMTPVIYGMTTHGELFTPRQLTALNTFTDLVQEARKKGCEEALEAGRSQENAQSYADALATYLALAVSRLSDICNSLCMWENTKTQVRHVFTRSAIPMLWDFAEPNVFSNSAGDFGVSLGNSIKALMGTPAKGFGIVEQKTADASVADSKNYLFATDPPYYDNVPYADLADFFYVWLRRALRPIYPDLLGTMLVPKAQELVADPFRQGGKDAARRFFEEGMESVFARMCQSVNLDYPITVFYAFKQTEEEDASGTVESGDVIAPTGSGKTKASLDFVEQVTASTGWETILQGMISAGMQVTGTWPMRTELANRMRGLGSNALASSIVLVCRPRREDAPIATRREFITALRHELEDALLKMMHGNIAPVDLAQATIGPGMAVYSRYNKVIETNGEPLRVRAALQIINQELDTILSATEGDYDGDTRFCLAWFEQFGMNPGAFGDADNMARAKNTSVAGLAESGVLASGAGKVRLLKREEYPTDWDPQSDTRKPVWEGTQYLVRALEMGGEGAAARLCKMLGGGAEPARDLAYRLYSICERKGWASEALAYNSLVIAWPEITRLASNPNILITATGLFAESEL